MIETFLEMMRPCCGFDRWELRKFIKAIEFADEETREEVLLGVTEKGNLTPDTWQLFIGSISYLPQTINQEEITEWFGECYKLTCEQWVLLVESVVYKSDKPIEPPADLPPLGNRNFRLKHNWEFMGITDETSFRAWLDADEPQEYAPKYKIYNQYQGGYAVATYTISDFVIIGDILMCTINGDGDYFGFNQLYISDFSAIVLPNITKTLKLGNNLMTVINPIVPLPTTLQTLQVNNQISDWSLSESWANSLPNGFATMYFQFNKSSPNGTNFKAILESKGYTVYG